MRGTVDMTSWPGDRVTVDQGKGQIVLAINESSLTGTILLYPTTAEAKVIRDLLDNAITEAEFVLKGR